MSGSDRADQASDTARPPYRHAVLRRTTGDDKMLFGVAGGLGRYLGIEPTVVRIALVVLALFGGSGVLLYLVGLVVIPPERPGDTLGPGAASGRLSPAIAIGVALILIGGAALLRELLPDLNWLSGPMLLILLGLGLLLGARR